MGRNNIHQPIMCIESHVIYTCLSEASKAMGRYPQYVSERLRSNLPCFDSNGNQWTFQKLDPSTITTTRRRNMCYVDEIPEKLFSSYSDLSRAIGQRPDYVSYCLKHNASIKDKSGTILHLHVL